MLTALYWLIAESRKLEPPAEELLLWYFGLEPFPPPPPLLRREASTKLRELPCRCPLLRRPPSRSCRTPRDSRTPFAPTGPSASDLGERRPDDPRSHLLSRPGLASWLGLLLPFT